MAASLPVALGVLVTACTLQVAVEGRDAAPDDMGGGGEDADRPGDIEDVAPDQSEDVEQVDGARWDTMDGCSWRAHDGHDYVFCGAVALTWEDARRECETRGMHMIVVDGGAENDWVNNEALKASSASAIDAVWLGGSDAAVEGEWRWPDGRLFSVGLSTLSRVFSRWADTQPDDAGTGEDCLALSLRTTKPKEWLDADCLSAGFAFAACESD